MSKRKQLRQRGWIEFQGLKHVRPYMTRSELVETIHAFFQERGLSLSDRSSPLPIRFSLERDPRIIDEGREMPVSGVHISEGGKTTEIVVYVRSRKSRGELVSTLFHELDHAGWLLEGRSFDHTQKYWVRPHEIRARRTGREWRQRLSR